MRRWLFVLCLAACGDDDGVGQFADAPLLVDGSPADAIVRSDAPVGDPSGAWQSGTALFACFSASGNADLGDTIAEATTSPTCCFWDRSGLLYYPNNMGTWTLDGPDRLVITVDPPCGEDCGPVVYTPLDTVDCTF